MKLPPVVRWVVGACLIALYLLIAVNWTLWALLLFSFPLSLACAAGGAALPVVLVWGVARATRRAAPRV